MTTEVELRSVLAVVLPLLGTLLTIILAQTAYIVRRVDRRVDDMTTKVDAHEPRIARLERSDELDQLSTDRVLDLMDRHVALWQERHESLKREHDKEHASMQREHTAMQREHTAMQRELDEFRDELRSIRDQRNRRGE